MSEVARLVEPVWHDLHGVFGTRLVSLAVYGMHAHVDAPAPSLDQPVHTLALVDVVTFSDLAACASHALGWHRRHLATPLLLPLDEFERSLDAFPLEYGEILAHHIVVAGRSPFERMTVSADDVRRACEVQAKSHLLHLREGYIDAAGNPAAIAALVTTAARAFGGLLGSVARLQGLSSAHHHGVATHAEQQLELPPGLVRDILDLGHRPHVTPDDAVRLFPASLDAAERLARYVDQWGAE